MPLGNGNGDSSRFDEDVVKPGVTVAIIMERIHANEKERERDREERQRDREALDSRLQKLEEKIDQALAERNMAIGAYAFITRAAGVLMVLVPGLAWLYEHGFFGWMRPPR